MKNLILVVMLLGTCTLFSQSKTYLPEMVKVKGGNFKMGNDNGSNTEKPAHQVKLSPFSMGKYEITFAQYDAFCVSTKRVKPKDEGWGRGKHPAINVSWVDANEYCNWLSKETGKHYRLPTEAEWEYCARAGNEKSNVDSLELNKTSWNDDNSAGHTHPVGGKKQNNFGLFDMAGNVWEWCHDEYETNYYKNSPEENPQGPEIDNRYRVIRGWSFEWPVTPGESPYTVRMFENPKATSKNIGFRVVLSN